MSETKNGNIIIYQFGDGINKIGVNLKDENVMYRQVLDFEQGKKNKIMNKLHSIWNAS